MRGKKVVGRWRGRHMGLDIDGKLGDPIEALTGGVGADVKFRIFGRPLTFSADIFDAKFAACDHVPQESSVIVTGTVRADERSPGGVERRPARWRDWRPRSRSFPRCSSRISCCAAVERSSGLRSRRPRCSCSRRR